VTGTRYTVASLAAQLQDELMAYRAAVRDYAFSQLVARGNNNA
jgi:hypothetical protein